MAVGDIDGIRKSAEITSFSIQASIIYRNHSIFSFKKKCQHHKPFFLVFDRIPYLRKRLPYNYPEDDPKNYPEEVKLNDHDTKTVLESKPLEEENIATIVRRLEKSLVSMDEKIQSQQQEQQQLLLQQQENFMKEIRKELTEMKTEFANVSNKIN